MRTYTSGNLESETVSIAAYHEFINTAECQELTDEEVLVLAVKAGTFDFLDNPGEDIYSVNDGEIKDGES